MMYHKRIIAAITVLFLLSSVLLIGFRGESRKTSTPASTGMVFPSLRDVKVNDSFWGPKLKLYKNLTINDVFDKFEGKYQPESRRDLLNEYNKLGRTRNAFRNFDLVSNGNTGQKQHDGPPWYDGLVYETIKAASDFLQEFPDENTEKRVDSYIDLIEAAQNSGADGYINTYTTLIEPEHRWGTNGGFERYQHDVYNSGALIEAAVHYYTATGKTKLLNVAVKCANNICNVMGPAPKRNIIPGHALPEEAMMKLYLLFRNEPALKNKIAGKVNEQDYYDMARFWVESRGVNCGLPLWNVWSPKECEKWIKDNTYSDAKYGNHSRPSWGLYNQDSIPFFRQKTIEGHAVRATLFGAGLATIALENSDPDYIETSSSLWDNMAGKRMHITGGCGSFRYEEMFGPDYVLPSDGYLETCAAVGSAFFSARMAELHGEAKYFDAFERSLYNNVLSGVSLSGDQYTYENPLVGEGVKRWSWHSCPCCPPMFLKIMGELPKYIYSQKNETIFVNLFIGSQFRIKLDNNHAVMVSQTTGYPWNGNIVINIEPAAKEKFTVKVRIPGWAQNVENPYGLYRSEVRSGVMMKVNGKETALKMEGGYAYVTRKWDRGDKIELSLPMEPRFVYANEKVLNLKGMAVIASGPIVYGLEEMDNPGLKLFSIDAASPAYLSYEKDLLNGVNVVKGKAINRSGEKTDFMAVPFYAMNNRTPGNAFSVWMRVK